MQMQDYLPFFQNLFLEYYQFTLENPVYAACLAVAVWLLTTIFYSLRIGILNRRNGIMLKARLDAESALTAAQQQMERLQQEMAAAKEQVEQEMQRSAALQERISGLAGQISDSIVALAAEPELGQQGLSVSPGLEVEHLWQRYGAAVKQLGENLIAQRRTNSELQQAVSAETAKLAEKDSQLEAMQVRLDTQRQQVAKLELTVEEQKAQLAQQQESEKQRLSAIETKHQADLARLAILERQLLERTQVKEQQVQEKPKAPEIKAPEISVAQPEPVKPVEIKPSPVQAPAVEPQQVKAEPKPAVVAAATPEPTIARAEMAKPQPAKADEGASSGITGKFKSLFSGAKQQMEKLDDMFGLSTPMLPPEEPKQTVRVRPEPEPVPAPIPVSEPAVATVERAAERTKEEVSGGIAGKFKNLFGSSKSSVTPVEAVPPTETIAKESVETVVEVREPEPSDAAGDEITAETGKATGKLKNLFGRFKR